MIPFALSAQVSNNMTLLDQWDVNVPSASGVKYNDLWGYTDSNGREYAIVGSAAFIHIVDVTDPTSVVEVDRVPGGQTTIWRDFKTYQDRIYAVSDNTSEGLIIMDASYLPDSVHVTYRSAEYFDMCHNIYIDEEHGRVYVAGANSQNNGLIVLDVSQDLDNPTLITRDDLPGGGYIHDLYVNDHIVYASHGWNGLYIWDYSDPMDIQLLANVGTNGYNHSSWLTEDYRHLVYAEEVPSGVDMGVIDVDNLYNGEIEIEHLFKFPLLAPTHTNVTPHNPYIRDTMLVVSYYDDGTQVYDIGDPMNVQPYAYYDTYPNTSYVGSGNWGTYPFLPSGNIISSDIVTGLYVMKMDDYDFSTIDYNPTFPEVHISIGSGHDECDGSSAALMAGGDYRFYQWFKDGILIPNWSANTYTATESGMYRAVGLQGQKKVSSEGFEFTIVAPPTLAVQGNAIDAFPQDGNFDWLINGKHIGMAAINSSTIHPGFSGYFQVERTVDDCTLKSDSIYFFSPRELNIHQLDGLHARYVHGENSIAISLESNEPVELSLNIYNILGQSMHREDLSFNGFRRFSFDRRSLSTGIYFITVDNGKDQDSYKLYIP